MRQGLADVSGSTTMVLHKTVLAVKNDTANNMINLFFIKEAGQFVFPVPLESHYFTLK